MAAAHHSVLDDISGWYTERDHPHFFHEFTREQQEAMIEEDLRAGHNVPRLLFSVIVGGVMLGLVSVVAIALQ